MTDKELKKKAVDALLGDSSLDSDYYRRILEYANFEGYTSINPLYMKNVGPENYIVLMEDIYSKLLEFQRMTAEKKVEIPYFLYGKKNSDGIICFDNISYNLSNLSRKSADFNPMKTIVEDEVLMNKIKELAEIGMFNKGPFERFVVCAGHSHVKELGSDNFSLRDLESAVSIKNSAPFFRSEYVKTMNMLLAPSGDFNFYMYDDNALFEGFYKYPLVYVMKNDGNIAKLPAYDRGNYSVVDRFAKGNKKR